MEVEVDLLADCMPRAVLGHPPCYRGGGLRRRRNRGSHTGALAAAPQLHGHHERAAPEGLE
eukprot:5110502-Heterocapsa_arctica.AAC.1